MKAFGTLLATALLMTTPLFADATSDARAHSDSFARAFAARDAKAMLALYADDARVIWPGEGQEAIGRAEIGRLIDGMLKAFPSGTLILKSQDAMALGPRYIAVVGQWEQTAKTPDGHMVTFHVRTTEILRKVGTQWLYAIDHASIGLPPPPPPRK